MTENLREVIKMWLNAHGLNYTHGWDLDESTTSLLSLLSQHGVVQKVEKPNANEEIPNSLYVTWVRPLEEA